MTFVPHNICYLRHENHETALALYPENSCSLSYKGGRPIQILPYGSVIEKSTKQA